jgi:hypothetical protein
MSEFTGKDSFALGLIVGLVAMNLAPYITSDRGRGERVQACAEGYKGIIKVEDESSLAQLAQIAIANDIQDTFSFSNLFSSDFADSDGELACVQPNGEEVLLPAGDQAAQMSRGFEPMTGTLPNGLSWVAHKLLITDR